jgi:hypothetical protein
MHNSVTRTGRQEIQKLMLTRSNIFTQGVIAMFWCEGNYWSVANQQLSISALN